MAAVGRPAANAPGGTRKLSAIVAGKFGIPQMSERQAKAFPPAVAALLLGVPAIYLIVNVSFAIYCVPALFNSDNDPVCRVSGIFGYLDDLIPAISRAIGVFKDAGNVRQMRIIQNVYEFCWGSAIVGLLVMLLVSLGWLAIRGNKSRQESRKYLEHWRRSITAQQAKTIRRGILLVLVIAIGLLLDAWFGDPAFNRISSYAGRVYVQWTDFLWLIFQLFIFLLGVVIAIFAYVQARALKGLSGTPST